MPFKTSERDKHGHGQEPDTKPRPEAHIAEAPEDIVRSKKYETPDQHPGATEAPSAQARPKVAVILGSKGVEAFASLPLLNLLDNSGIHVDLVIGCSGGGVIAALWSAGFNLKQIQQFFSHFCTSDNFTLPDAEELVRLANDNFDSRNGIYNTDSQFKAYKQIFKDTRIEDLSPRTIFHATDIRTGEGVVLDRGEVAPAIQACSALYPIMTPVEVNGRLLVDGSYTMPLPVIEAVQRSMDLILVSFASVELDPNPTSLLASFININRITTNSLRKAQFFSSVNMHNYEICFAPVRIKDSFFPWDVQHIPKIVSAGKQAALDAMPELQQLYANFTRCTPHSTEGCSEKQANEPQPEQEQSKND